MKTTTEAKCLLDFWSIEINEEIEAAAKAGVPAHKHTLDFEMGNTMMDFLFASQDASTASLTWIFALLDEHPEVLAKVRDGVMCRPRVMLTSGRSVKSRSASDPTTRR
jgi:cytochrome P450 family 710 subfamily A protein